MKKTIKQLAKENGLSINRLALKASITPTDLYAVINGKRELFPKWRNSIAKVLNVDSEEIIPYERGGDADE